VGRYGAGNVLSADGLHRNSRDRETERPIQLNRLSRQIQRRLPVKPLPGWQYGFLSMSDMNTVIQLNASDASLVSQFLRIYQSSIEPSEQKTAAQMGALVSDPNYRFHISVEGEKVTGFAMTFIPVRENFVLLEYMAVDEQLRSRGIGAALFQAASDIAEQYSVPLVLEVDQPGSSISPGNDTTRRLRFYAEQGCRRIVGLDYILPLSAHGSPPPMWLLARGREQALSRSEIRDWLTTLYVEVYGQPETDPRMDAMLSKTSLQEFPLSPIT
jgi:GNAT superfamily N-acetyltransferase